MYNMFGTPPQSGVVYVPVPSPPTGGAPDINTITNWISGLEQLKKVLKEEKKDDKPKEPKGGDLHVINMMLLMILVSPVTGPIMSWFFHKGLSMMSGG